MDIYGQILEAAPLVLVMLFVTSLACIALKAPVVFIIFFVLASLLTAAIAFPIWPMIGVIAAMVVAWIVLSNMSGNLWLHVVRSH